MNYSLIFGEICFVRTSSSTVMTAEKNVYIIRFNLDMKCDWLLLFLSESVWTISILKHFEWVQSIFKLPSRNLFKFIFQFSAFSKAGASETAHDCSVWFQTQPQESLSPQQINGVYVCVCVQKYYVLIENEPPRKLIELCDNRWTIVNQRISSTHIHFIQCVCNEWQILTEYCLRRLTQIPLI